MEDGDQLDYGVAGDDPVVDDERRHGHRVNRLGRVLTVPVNAEAPREQRERVDGVEQRLGDLGGVLRESRSMKAHWSTRLAEARDVILMR